MRDKKLTKIEKIKRPKLI